MKLRSLLSMSMAAATLLTSGIPGDAATSSPLIALYRVNGVRDNGAGSFSGLATAFLCTNWNTAPEAIQVFIKDLNGALVAGSPKIPVAAGANFAAVTHATIVYGGLLLGGGNIQGSALILGTSPQISCTAMMLDASTPVPNGIALHMVRFNAPAGSQE